MGQHITGIIQLLDKMKVLLALLGVLCFLSCILPQASSQEISDKKNVGKLFGGYSTRTRLSTLTSTVLYTCALTVAGGVACSGRKKRNIRVLETLDDVQSLEKRSLDVESSQGELEPVGSISAKDDI